MLSAFIKGTGDCDVMGLGGNAFGRTFYRNSEYMHQIIMRVTKQFVHKALLKDICASIEVMIKEGKVDALERSVILEKAKIN